MAQELMDKKPALSGWPMLIFWWAMILFALQSSTHMVGAGDTWVAMACGRHFLNHGVNTVEPFSVNSHKPGPTPEEVKTWPRWAQWITDKVGLDTVKFWHPTGWVDQNWLTHVFFYWLTHLSPVADAETFDKPIVEQNINYNSLVYWKYALYIVTIIVVYYTTRLLGVNPALSAAFSCFALFVGRTFFDIRPAGFTNLLVAVLLFVFVLAVYKNYLYIWLIVPVISLWCNLHGGYVYAFVVLVPFIGLHLLLLLPKRAAMCLYYSLGWLFFYALAVKFRSHEYLQGIAKLNSAGLFYFILVLIAAGIAVSSLKNIKTGLLYVYYIAGTFIVLIATSNMFYPQGIEMVARQPLARDYVADSQIAYFITLIGFVIIAVLLSAFKSRLKTISFKAWWHTVAAAVVAFVVMILVNPFRLTNLTHTFVVSVSEDAKLWKTVNEWHPAFEWSNPVGDEMPFFYMYVAAWVLLVLWVVCLLLKPGAKPQANTKQTKAKQPALLTAVQYEWPMIDLPLLAIAALTIYMAVDSRRFIPIAAIAACPIMAMFIDSSVKMSITSRKFIPVAAIIAVTISASFVLALANKLPKFTLSPITVSVVVASCLILAAIIEISFNMLLTNIKGQTAARITVPKELQYLFISLAFAGTLTLTIWWGYWYKAIYLNPWPDSGLLHSVFMRMTASYAKPFVACQFIRDNKLSGTVFNYWTEGGFVAYGQIPEPNGKTPLQLYMDGRAQAAYNTDTYQRWMRIMSGGDPVRLAQNAGRAMTESDYEAVGKWLEEEFQKENVTVVFMPTSQIDTDFIRGLTTNPNWRTVYMDDEQRIYVDIKSQQGKDLYVGIFTGQTKYPDDFTKNLTVGYNMIRLQDQEQAKKGFEFMIQAFTQHPSQISTLELMHAMGFLPKLRDTATSAFSQYLDDFIGKKQTYKMQDGYREKLIAAMLIGDFLANVNRNNPGIAEKYRTRLKEFSVEQQQINESSRW